MTQIEFVFESTCLRFDQEENYLTWICGWINLVLIWPRRKWSESKLCLNRLVSDLTKRKMIQPDFFKINLVLIRPRGKSSDSKLWLNCLVSVSTKRKMIQLDWIYFWIVFRSERWHAKRAWVYQWRICQFCLRRYFLARVTGWHEKCLCM